LGYVREGLISLLLHDSLFAYTSFCFGALIATIIIVKISTSRPWGWAGVMGDACSKKSGLLGRFFFVRSVVTVQESPFLAQYF